MSHRPLDLSALPPEMRRAVEQQLAKLPPQARERLLREGSPLVEKMIAKMGGVAPPPLPAAARNARDAARHAAQEVHGSVERATDLARRHARIEPKGHYNATVRPGDTFGGGRFLMVVVALVALFWVFWR